MDKIVEEHTHTYKHTYVYIITYVIYMYVSCFLFFVPILIAIEIMQQS